MVQADINIPYNLTKQAQSYSKAETKQSLRQVSVNGKYFIVDKGEINSLSGPEHFG